MSQKFYIKTETGKKIDITSDVLKNMRVESSKLEREMIKRDVTNTLNNEFEIKEVAYIRTRTMDEINDLIEVSTYLDRTTPINISSMFYKKDSSELYDEKFMSYDIYLDSLLSTPTTTRGRLFKLFQNKKFIVSAIYKNNNVDEDIDPKHWTFNPQGVNAEWPYEWKVERVKKLKTFENGKSELIWEPFTYPILYNNFYTGNDYNNIQCNDNGIQLTIKGIKYDLIINDDYSLSVKRT